MEEAGKGLEQLQALRDYPKLVEEVKRLRHENEEQNRTIQFLSSEVESLRETKKKVDEQANSLLDKIIAKRRDPKIRFTEEEQKYVHSLKKKINKLAVDMRDDHCSRLIEKESERRANEKLEELKKVQWPTWFSRAIKPEIELLKIKVNVNVFRAIRGPWSVSCRACGTEGKYTLSPWGAAQLLLIDHIWVNCINQECRKRFRVSLSDIIASHFKTIEVTNM